MAKAIPFDDDTMTLIMGLGGPGEPGQHGRRMIPAPEQGAIDLITKIRDMCDDFLMTADKEKKPEEKEDMEKPEDEEAEE